MRCNDELAAGAHWLRYSGIFFLIIAMVAQTGLAADAIPAAAAGPPAYASPPVKAGAPADPVPATAAGAPADPAPAATLADPADPSGGSLETRLLLEVYINGQSTGKIGEFILRRNRLMAKPSDLRDLGFKIALSRASEADALIQLSDLRGVKWTLDLVHQVLQITADNDALLPTLLLLADEERAAGHRVIESGTGVTLNDDIVATHVNGGTGATGSFDLRAFSAHGVVSSGWLGYAGDSSGASRNTAIRLDTAYSFADAKSLRRYTAGDFVTTGVSWARSVRLEGFQIRSDFSMRPDLVTFPMPSVLGVAEVPSTVKILTDGNMAVSQKVDAGPFQTPQLPVITGAGTITMTVTNALGQQVTVSQPFYASSSLLAPGLQTYSGQLGLVRRNWGAISNDYGKMAGNVNYRRGLTRKFTIEASAEGTSGAGMAGAGGVLQIGNLGVLNFAASPSIASGKVGSQFSAGAQRIGRVFSLGASEIVASRDYRDVASMNGSGIVRSQLSAFSSLALRQYGSIGVAYADLKQDPAPTLRSASAVSTHSRVFTASYSVTVHRVSFYASGLKNLVGTGSNAIQFGMTYSFGKYRTIGSSVDTRGNRQLQVQQSAPEVGDWGYEVYGAGGDSTHTFAQGQYKSRVGLFTAGVDRSAGQTAVRLESDGAISFADGALFASNKIYDSFAIVDTRPVTNVRVYQENRNVANTGESGRVLVPDMRAFDINHIGIEATDIPPDVALDFDKRVVRPQDRSGVVVKFPVRFSHSALLQLVSESGDVVPQGSTATLRATGAVVPVGYDGAAYVEDLSPKNEVLVQYPNGKTCTAKFDYHSVPGDIPTIGPLRCEEKRP